VPAPDPFRKEAATVVARPPAPYADSISPVPSPGPLAPFELPTGDRTEDFPDPSRLSLEAALSVPRRPSESPPT